MAISDKYTFNSDLGELKPTNSELVWEWRKESDNDFFIKHLSTELRLQNISKTGVNDFDKLYDIVKSKQICEPIRMTINKTCDGGTTEFLTGYLSIVDGKYDLTRCVVDIKPRSTHGLSCIVDNWDRENNFYGIGTPVSVSRTEGVLVYKTCEKKAKGQPFNVMDNGDGTIHWHYAIDCLPPPDNLVELYPRGWTPFRNEMRWVGNSGMFQDPLLGTLHLKTTYVREEWPGFGAPSTPGWKYDDIENVYYRPVPTYVVDETPDQPGSYDLIFRQWAVPDQTNSGRTLNDVLKALFRVGCGYDVISNFFGVNPDGTQPDNKAYAFAMENLQELILFQKLDVLLGDPDEVGTDYPIRLKQLWKNLKVIFNLEMRLDGGAIRIEHVSYFSNRFMLDLTTSEMRKFIIYKGQFEYKKEELPRYERWFWMDQTNSRFFDEATVEYEGACIDDEENQEIAYSADLITTNIDELSTNPDAYNDEGFVLVAAKNGTIIRGAPEGFDFAFVNGVLSWGVLLENLHIWKRKKTSGIMNGENRRFIGLPKNRVQKDIQVPICCDEIDEFAPEDLVKTQFGWGAVESASWNSKTEILTLTLLHD